MLNFLIEKDFLKKIEIKSSLIGGIDEVGRGALAGPVVASSIIILNQNINENIISRINDSKKISAKNRKEISELLWNSNAIIGVGVVDNSIIDEVNILNATFMAMEKSFESLRIKPDGVLVDGNKIPKNIKTPAIAVVKGDAKSLSIAAASIIAKVYRDEIMDNLSLKYPEYEWGKNKGYGTKSHYEAIAKYGITPYHRKSFKLMKQSAPLDGQCLPLFPS